MPYTHLTRDDRVRLSALNRVGHTQKEIAKQLGKHRTTIWRELQRNKTNNKSGYDARVANDDTRARRHTANQQFRKITKDRNLQNYITRKLKKYWSPEQIAGRLKKKNRKAIVSHESIYQYIYHECPRLKKYLRCQKGKYRRKRGTRKREKQRREKEKRRIDTRPTVIEKRSRIGDWEGDTVRGSEKTTGILTHVERKSGLLLADKLVRALAETVYKKTTERFKKIPKDKKHSITYDNGIEFSEHERIEKDTRATIYFAYPYHSWERGTNENTNGLLRQFFPKGTPFATITQKQIDEKVKLINQRPRKRLNYSTPLEIFRE